MANNNTLNIAQLIGSDDEFYRLFKNNIMSSLRVAMPGIIQSFNSNEQTVTIKPALREQIINADQSVTWAEIPLLLDVPICLPKAGGYALTLPIEQGDECLVIFSDRCIDAWWSYGGIQNQIESRKHDFSDAFALLSTWSQPNVIVNYSTTAAELRTLDGNTKISLKPGEVDINAQTLNINVPTVNINGITFGTHTHNAPSGGGQTSGPS
jgi:hypothetical protein